MPYESDRASVSKRFREIQELCGHAKPGEQPDNAAFSDQLNAAAEELGFTPDWTSNQVSKVRGATLGIDTTGMTIVARVDPKQRGYTYVAFGIAVAKGEDPWTVLARTAKKAKRA